MLPTIRLFIAMIASTRKNPFRHRGKRGVTDCIAVVIWIGSVLTENGKKKQEFYIIIFIQIADMIGGVNRHLKILAQTVT